MLDGNVKSSKFESGRHFSTDSSDSDSDSAGALRKTSRMTDKKESNLNWRLPIPAQDSATLRISDNLQKISILSALNEVLKERRSLEHRRNSLLQSAVLRQHQVQETKNQFEVGWQEKLNEAEEIAEKHERECAALRERRDKLHKELIIFIDRTSCHRFMQNIPSIRANYRIQACQLQRDISDLKRRVNNAKLRLDTEKKVAESLSNTVKELRLEAGTKKFNSMSIRPKTLAILSHPTQCKTTRENFRLRNAPGRSTARGVVNFFKSNPFKLGALLNDQN